MLKNFTLISKIISISVVSIISILIVTVSSYVGFKKVGLEIEEIVEYQVPINSLVTELGKDILKEEILTYELIFESKNINSTKYKHLEKEINDLEIETSKTIKKLEDLVIEAINHNVDIKTKNKYKQFSKDLVVLEKEQKEFKKYLKKFEKDLSTGNSEHLQKDKELIISELKQMDKNILKLTKKMEELLKQSSLTAEELEQKSIVIIVSVSLIILVLTTIFILYLVKDINSSIKNFYNGLNGFFKYLNRESDDVVFLNDSSKDELGTLAKVINENIIKTKKGIEEDREFIDETIYVLSEFEQGDLCQRIKCDVKNPALKELKKVLDSMGDQMENNIENVLDILEEYSNYNYMNKVDTSSVKNQLLALANGVNSLGDSITKMLVENKNVGSTLSSSSQTLLTNVDVLNDTSNAAAASLEQTAAALEEITETIVTSTQSMGEMSILASKVVDSVEEGNSLSQKTSKAMDEINEQVGAINDAITVIDQIAFQTNILSLNAAVEAATAGEAGKGFAVVAAEVRNLANKSAEAANEIKTLVENANSKTAEGKNISDKMILGYETLNKNINNTIGLIQQVEESSKEQQVGIEQINDAIAEQDQQTQQIAKAANETHKIAIDTNSISDEIVDNLKNKKF